MVSFVRSRSSRIGSSATVRKSPLSQPRRPTASARDVSFHLVYSLPSLRIQPADASA